MFRDLPFYQILDDYKNLINTANSVYKCTNTSNIHVGLHWLHEFFNYFYKFPYFT